MAKCRECETGTLEIIGTGYYGDTIEVECNNPDCGEVYEVEPDGLGEGGLEMVEAQMIERRRSDVENIDYDV